MMAMTNSSGEKKEPTQEERPPEQKLGDTPVAPWNMPTSAEKAAAKPVRRALRKALSEVDSPEKADAVLEQLESDAAQQTVPEVAKATPTPATPAQGAQQVAAASEQANAGECAPAVLAETARVLAAAEGRSEEALAEAAQEVLNPEQQGAPAAAQQQSREYLRGAVLKRLKPLDAFDANLFLQINHLPHTPWLNKFFYTLTYIFTGGAAWYVLMGVITLFNRQLGWRIIREALLPLILATTLVEHPIKWYFRRKRPFITMIQTIVIGKKPGTWSFPSGHSATAFGGAWLLSRYFPKQRSWLYSIASLVAFSRVYLGDHYPGDVVSGSLSGILLSEFFRRLPWPWRRKS